MQTDGTPTESMQALDRLEEILWVEQARSGDSAAFTRLLSRYERPIIYYLRRITSDAQAALDLSQEVWLDVFRGLPRLVAPQAFRVWVFRIAHHKANRLLRRKQAIEAAEADVQPEPATEADPVCSAEELHLALDRLPSGQREVLTFHYLRDLSLTEIGAVLDCPVGTVKSRLFHARLALRNLLEKYVYE